MIRRDSLSASGPRWVLVSQVAHARLAADIAHHWLLPDGRPAAKHAEFLQTIWHHDDGWTEWEKHPEIDPASGRPRSFTEMRLASSLAIWQASVDSAVSLGQLAPWLVAGHFAALLRASSHCDEPLALEWLANLDARRAQWLAAWLRENPAHSRDQAQTALAYLQLFDTLSLWLCCAEAIEPAHLALPGGDRLTLVPQAPGQIGLRPWPLEVTTIELGVKGESIPQAHYANDAALARAPREPVTLTWQWFPVD